MEELKTIAFKDSMSKFQMNNSKFSGDEDFPSMLEEK